MGGGGGGADDDDDDNDDNNHNKTKTITMVPIPTATAAKTAIYKTKGHAPSMPSLSDPHSTAAASSSPP